MPGRVEGLRRLRKETRLRSQPEPLDGGHEAPLQPEPPAGSRPPARQADPGLRLHPLPQGRQGAEGRLNRPTLYEFAGGDAAFLALAHAHHARCLADPELNHPFSHADQHPQHVERLAAYWAEVLGGPAVFSHACGDESHVLDLHCGNGDMGDLPQRFYDCFVAALDDAGLPDDAEFRAALQAYMRWAVDNVMAYSAVDTVVPAGLAMPRWGWDGLQTPA
jgi:hemoglobin